MLVAQHIMQVKFTMTLDLQMIYQFGSFVIILSPTNTTWTGRQNVCHQRFEAFREHFLQCNHTKMFCSKISDLNQVTMLLPFIIASLLAPSSLEKTPFQDKCILRELWVDFLKHQQQQTSISENIQEFNAKSLQLITSLTETQSHLKQVHFTPNCLHSRHTSQDQRL